MPRWSASAASTATWSRTVIRGKADPHGGSSSGRSEDGPVLPWQPPSTLGATTNHLRLSIGASGPMRPSHQPAVRVPGAARPDHVGVAGQGVQHEHRVRGVGVELAPRLVRDAHARQVPAELEVERPELGEAPVTRVISLAPAARRGG